MERNKLVDRLKGYACFLVLFGHVIMGMRKGGVTVPAIFFGTETFIWSFHVSLFLFLSGVVYKVTGEWKSKKTRKDFIVHKLINLGVPYVVFSAVYVLINNFVGQVNTTFSITDLLNIWKTPVAQYWYLYALFFLFCIWTFCYGTLKNWQITVAVFLTGYFAPLFGVQYGAFEAAIFSGLAFGLGTCVDISLLEKISVPFKFAIIAIHIILGAVLIKFGFINYPFIKEFIMVVGIFASVLLISMLHKIRVFAICLDFISKYSFQIYLMHTIFTAGVRIVLLKLNITNWGIHLVTGCVAGLFISVFAAFIARKIEFLNIVFFPVKTIERLKKRKNEIS